MPIAIVCAGRLRESYWRDAAAYTIMIPDLRPYTDELAPICDCVCLTLREAGEAILCR